MSFRIRQITNLRCTSIADGPFATVQSAQVRNPRARRRNRVLIPKRGFCDKLLVAGLQAISRCSHSGIAPVLVGSFAVVGDPLARAARVEPSGRDAGVCAGEAKVS